MERRKLLVTLSSMGLIVALAAILLMAACAKPAPAPTAAPAPAPTAAPAPAVIKWDFATYSPNSGAVAESLQWWADEVKKRTGGRLEMTIHWAGSLFGTQEIPAAVSRGAIQAGFVTTAQYSPKELPLHSLELLAAISSDMYAMLAAEDELWNTNAAIKAELAKNNIVPAYAYGTSAHQLFTKDKPIKTLDDLKGLKLRAFGGYATVLKELGVTPVAIAAGETATSVQSGIVNGAHWTPDIVNRYGVIDVTNCYTVADLGALSGLFGAINADEWNKLPADIQKVFLDIRLPAGHKLVELTLKVDDEVVAKMKQKGFQMFELSSADKQKIKDIAHSQWTVAAQDIDKTGLPGSQVLDSFLALVTKYTGKY